MRIAHITATFPPYRGGTGNVCFHNARELLCRGHDVHVFTVAVDGAPASDVCEGIHVHRLNPLMRVGNAAVLPGLLTTLQDFDVIHLHYPFFGGELTALAAKFSGTPLVVTYHQDVFLNGLMGLTEKLLRHTLGRFTLRSAARVLFTSEDYGKASYIRPLLKGREEHIGELPNGVDVRTFRPGQSSDKLRTVHNLGASDRIALLVAGLDRAHSFKGVHVFLSALAQLTSDVKGIIVGDGDMRATYEAEARKLNIAERVIFAGRASDEELRDYYRLADVTVLPSVTMGEAFGLVLVESMASGTPVIASNLPGVRTVVSPGTDGLLIEPNDATDLANALDRMLGDDATQHSMAMAGRRKVETRYDWEQIGSQLENLYLQIHRQPVTHTSVSV